MVAYCRPQLSAVYPEISDILVELVQLPSANALSKPHLVKFYVTEPSMCLSD